MSTPADAVSIDHSPQAEEHIDKYRCRTCGSEKIMVLAWADGNSNRIFLEEEVEYPEVDTVLCRSCRASDTYFLIPDQPFQGPKPDQTKPDHKVGPPGEEE